MFLAVSASSASQCSMFMDDVSDCGSMEVSATDDRVELLNPDDKQTMVYKVCGRLAEYGLIGHEAARALYRNGSEEVSARTSCDADLGACVLSWRNAFRTRDDIERAGAGCVWIILEEKPPGTTTLMFSRSPIAPREALTNYQVTAFSAARDPNNADRIEVRANVVYGTMCQADPTAVYISAGGVLVAMSNPGGAWEWVGSITRADVYTYGVRRGDVYDLNLTISVESIWCDGEYDNLPAGRDTISLVVLLGAPEVTVWSSADLMIHDLVFQGATTAPYLDECFYDMARLAVTVNYSYAFPAEYTAESIPGSGSMDSLVRLDAIDSGKCSETVTGPVISRNCSATFLTGTCLTMDKLPPEACRFAYIGGLNLQVTVNYFDRSGAKTRSIPYRLDIPGQTFTGDSYYSSCPPSAGEDRYIGDLPAPTLRLADTKTYDTMLQVFQLDIGGGPASSVAPAIQVVNISYDKGDGVIRKLDFSVQDKLRGMYDKNSFYYNDINFCRVSCSEDKPFYLTVSPVENTILADNPDWFVPARGHVSCENVVGERSLDRWSFRPLDLFGISDPRLVIRANVTITALITPCPVNASRRELAPDLGRIARSTADGLTFQLRMVAGSSSALSGALALFVIYVVTVF